MSINVTQKSEQVTLYLCFIIRLYSRSRHEILVVLAAAILVTLGDWLLCLNCWGQLMKFSEDHWGQTSAPHLHWSSSTCSDTEHTWGSTQVHEAINSPRQEVSDILTQLSLCATFHCRPLSLWEHLFIQHPQSFIRRNQKLFSFDTVQLCGWVHIIYCYSTQIL